MGCSYRGRLVSCYWQPFVGGFLEFGRAYENSTPSGKVSPTLRGDAIFGAFLLEMISIDGKEVEK